MRLPERLRRYHACALCGKERHRRRMYWNGREYICEDFDLCGEVIAHKERMAAYFAVSEEERQAEALERRRRALAEVKRQLGIST